MDRFGRPRFRGASVPKPYSTRPSHPQNESGLLGAAPSHPSGGGQYGSYQTTNSQEWQSNRSPGSLLGAPPNVVSGYSGGGSSSSRGATFPEENVPIPAEVRKLMQTLGLSLADVQKLSKLPENELSASRLAQVIEDLKHGKQPHSGDSSNPNRSTSHVRAGRSSFDNEQRGLLGSYPGQQSNRPQNQQQSFSDTISRHTPTGIKVTVKPVQQQYNRRESPPSNLGSGFGALRQYDRSDRKDDYHDRFSSNGGGSGSADRYDQQRSDSFSQNNRRFNNRNINERESEARPDFNNERRANRNNQDQRNPNSRGSFGRPGATRNQNKPASSLPSLMDLNPKPIGGLLGNPVRPNAQGLESLVAAVGGSSASSAASLLTPLMLATQADPSVLEAQIQAMKAIQAHAIKLKQGPHLDYPRGNRERNRPPRRRSPPPSRGAVVDKQLAEEAKKEAEEMRASRGRVLYIKYKSPRVLESDLKQLASAFGKVTNTLLIKPKIPNGHFQVFMELEQWDCAAAMLEHYMAKAPNIKGCPVEVRRSNYAELRRDQVRPNKRPRSVSPVREGSAQVSNKRDKKSEDKPNLSITASDSARKVANPQDIENSEDKSLTDAREILIRSREGKKGLQEKEGKDTDLLLVEDEAEKSLDTAETDKNKDEIVDPLDEIADELALDEEFDLMHGVNYGRDKKKIEKVVEDTEVKEEERKNATVDLERTDLDLDDVNVDENQEEERTAGKSTEDVEAEEKMEVKVEHEAEENNSHFTEVKNEDNNMEVKGKIEESKDQIMKDENQPPSSVDGSVSDIFLQSDEGSGNKHASLTQDELTSTDVTLSQESSDPTEDEENKEQSKPLEEKTDADNEEENEDEVDDVQSIIEDTLNEVIAAKDYLDALTKVTKARAAQALAKKMKVCLETAVALLNQSKST